jgi:hypothetical protein
MILESIHNDVMEAMAAKGKILYHMPQMNWMKFLE